jgi:hypothetical protein
VTNAHYCDRHNAVLGQDESTRDESFLIPIIFMSFEVFENLYIFKIIPSIQVLKKQMHGYAQLECK